MGWGGGGGGVVQMSGQSEKTGSKLLWPITLKLLANVPTNFQIHYTSNTSVFPEAATRCAIVFP